MRRPGGVRVAASDSHNSRLLRAAAQQLPPGVELELYDGLKQIPPFDEDDEAAPARRGAGVARRDRRGRRACCSRRPSTTPRSRASSRTRSTGRRARRPQAALRNKPVAVIGASTSMFGALWAQAELRKVLSASGARVIDAELAVATAHEAFDGEDR